MENTQKIKRIMFTKTVYPFCPLGKDNYRADIEVTVYPDSELFDFCEVDRKLEALSGQDLLIEDVADKVYALMQKYNPATLSVKVNGYSNRHFPVEVIKE